MNTERTTDSRLELVLEKRGLVGESVGIQVSEVLRGLGLGEGDEGMDPKKTVVNLALILNEQGVVVTRWNEKKGRFVAKKGLGFDFCFGPDGLCAEIGNALGVGGEEGVGDFRRSVAEKAKEQRRLFVDAYGEIADDGRVVAVVGGDEETKALVNRAVDYRQQRETEKLVDRGYLKVPRWMAERMLALRDIYVGSGDKKVAKAITGLVGADYVEVVGWQDRRCGFWDGQGKNCLPKWVTESVAKKYLRQVVGGVVEDGEVGGMEAVGKDRKVFSSDGKPQRWGGMMEAACRRALDGQGDIKQVSLSRVLMEMVGWLGDGLRESRKRQVDAGVLGTSVMLAERLLGLVDANHGLLERQVRKVGIRVKIKGLREEVERVKAEEQIRCGGVTDEAELEKFV